MANKRTIVQRGCPQYNEEGVASAEIKPGYLVKGVSTIALQTANGTKVPATFAVEKGEFGQGIDNSRQASGTDSAFYASGDRVRVAAFKPGDRVLAFVASGEDISEDELLVSAGDGTLAALAGSEIAVARALEAHSPNVVSGNAALLCEIV